MLSVLAVASVVTTHGYAHGEVIGCMCASCAIARRAALEENGGTGSGDLPPTFQINNRWSFTATNGNTGTQGTPITLTWGFVNDGLSISGYNSEPTSPSSLRARLDTLFGAGPGGSDLTQRPWFTLFQQAFNRWSQLAGLTYVYEPNDSGTFGSLGGSLGVRADIRIGGHTIDGASGVLAYNFFPNNGDMVIDTSESNNLSSSTNNYRSFRNILMHEHGHGLGFSHLESSNSRQLMEPFLDTSFDGPQLDDIMAAQRNYGDPNEKSGGNDTSSRATHLGTLTSSTPSLAVGTSTPNTNTLISNTMVDFVSIDDESDVDFYSFTLTEPGLVDITLSPRGYTYNNGPQDGTQTAFNSRNLSDLILQLWAPDGLTELSLSNLTGLGLTETLLDQRLFAGTYFARISGSTLDVIQMYRLDITFKQSLAIPEPASAALLATFPLLTSRRRRAA